MASTWSFRVKDGMLMNTYKGSSQIHIFQINSNQSITRMISTCFTYCPWVGWKHINETKSDLWWIWRRFLIQVIANTLSSWYTEPSSFNQNNQLQNRHKQCLSSYGGETNNINNKIPKLNRVGRHWTGPLTCYYIMDFLKEGNIFSEFHYKTGFQKYMDQ